MENIKAVFENFWDKMTDLFGVSNMSVDIIDFIEIFIIAFLFYHILIWIKSTRAWTLFKGIMIILLFVLIASIFQMSTVLWIAEKTLNVGLIALVVIFQPELRKALENLGNRNFFGRLFNFNKQEEAKFSDRTIDELVKASFAMGKVKTGALIVIEDSITLNEYIRTGIDVDGILTSQLLINIFEKNTPLHDGAVIVRGDRVISATCYLPLSDSLSLSKSLGTRHRAAVGISEVSDSLTIIVSEETGKVSMAMRGQIYHDIDPEFMREKLEYLQNRHREINRLELLRRRIRNGKENSKDSVQ